MRTKDEIYNFALSFFGRPYIWGGDGSNRYFGGLDCSGLVQEILKYAKADPVGDQTAATLYDYFLENGKINQRGFGGLSFYGTTSRISHVGFCIDDKVMINASGGGSHVKSLQSARMLNASVKIEPISFHKNLVAVIMPNYQQGFNT
jgi:cell wall-associated NlpC family hydrolase